MISFYEDYYSFEKQEKSNINSIQDKKFIEETPNSSDNFEKQQCIVIKKEENDMILDEQKEFLEPKNVKYKHSSRKIVRKNNEKTYESMDLSKKKKDEKLKLEEQNILYEDFRLVIKEKENDIFEISKKRKASLDIFKNLL